MKKPGKAVGFPELASLLAELGRDFYRRGWALGTSGNFSAVVSRKPLRLAITPSGVDKGILTADQIVQIGASGKAVVGAQGLAPLQGRPSDEAKLHLAVVRVRCARAVLHTHSVWSTIVSQACADQGGICLEGFEMLKGLEGVRSHAHREWLPILENSQDMAALARRVEETLKRHASSHAFLLRGHGFYTWGQDLAEAKRHVEILEFLLEVVGRTASRAPHDSQAVRR